MIFSSEFVVSDLAAELASFLPPRFCTDKKTRRSYEVLWVGCWVGGKAGGNIAVTTVLTWRERGGC